MAQVPGMEHRDAGQIGKGGGYQIKILSHPDHMQLHGQDLICLLLFIPIHKSLASAPSGHDFGIMVQVLQRCAVIGKYSILRFRIFLFCLL